MLGSCLTHFFEIQSAEKEIWLNSLELHVHAIQKLCSQPGFKDIPRWPHNFPYTVDIESDASHEPDLRTRELQEAVKNVCLILNLLVNPQSITGTVNVNGKANVSTLTKTRPIATAEAD